MSAAEKLRALEVDARRMTVGHGHAFVPHSLIDALPQIVAVVEAAEQSGGGLPDSRIMIALAALDEQLQGLTGPGAPTPR